MNENNNMNNDYTNNPAQPTDGNQYQEVSSQQQAQNTYQENTMYHYNEQGTGQYQQNAQDAGSQNFNAQNVGGGYQYTDATQNAGDQFGGQNAGQTYQYSDASQQGAGQDYNTYGGDQFTGGQSYSTGNAYNTYQTSGVNGQPPAHGKAVASLILGIAGLVCCGICGLIGLILAISAKNEGNNESIRTAGFVLGIIGCALWAVGVVVAIINGAFSSSMY